MYSHALVFVDRNLVTPQSPHLFHGQLQLLINVAKVH